MATRIAKCPKCNSENITEVNPEVREEVHKPVAKVTAACDECSEEFTYGVSTNWGHRRGILY